MHIRTRARTRTHVSIPPCIVQLTRFTFYLSQVYVGSFLGPSWLLLALLDAMLAHLVAKMSQQGLLQEERDLVGNATLSRLPIERRESAILELVDFCIAGMMKSVSSNRAKRALETSKSRIHDILLESVVKMFDAVELD